MTVAAKHSVARDFGEAARSYDDAARLQRHMGQALLAREGAPTVAGVRQVLDLGCGTGQFSAALANCYPGSAQLGLDLSPAMVAYAQARQRGAEPVDGSRNNPAMRWLVADAEQLPLADASVDRIFSNLMIQWCADPRPVLQECLRVLRPGGVLLCSSLLQGTLRELEAAWQRADPGRPHINRFESAEVFARQVKDACPSAEVLVETVRLRYRSPLALLQELKALGARYKGQGRRRTATAPGRLRAMCRHYPRTPRGDVLASYEAGYIICRKPA
ncbi:malonyl-ACP O-methyltransferase BioC [Marinobacter sp. X15-166B]|uniref:malonyl-ACP O-methyltransferase BioC n=1 Tax=Marinobacter sp. X15-166B TaxID=1897620 RepID=UPI00085CD5D4|nr:malonyl-ACP O-methyltransferase BioC [Marinobacter sp. X15-166B]OEY65233.1 malonyl-[acyl-carrier protein] O-methyltransferase BioC [Marinobacter sp. X15-166B]